MNWIELTDLPGLESLREKSMQQPVVIFKHSTRCSISSMAKSRLERAVPPADVLFYYLDLIRHRDLSGKIAEEYGVQHESPQILMIRDGECIYDDSHNGISMEEIEAQLVS